MKRIFPFFLFVLGLTTAAYCGETSKIELDNGNVIEGEIVSIDNGFYILDNGTEKIKVEAEKIKKIEIKNRVLTSEDNLSLTADRDSIKSKTKQIRRKMINNQKIMDIVDKLKTDPRFQEAIKDPKLVKAAKSQNIQTLITNEKILDLIEDPKIKEIANGLQNKQK